MSAALEITGFLLSITSWLITGSCLANNSWKVSTVAGSVITSSTLYENLWKACAKDSTGVSNCRDFESLLALPGGYCLCLNVRWVGGGQCSNGQLFDTNAFKEQSSGSENLFLKAFNPSIMSIMYWFLKEEKPHGNVTK